MVAISKTPEYLLFVNNLEANNYEAIKEVLDGLYISMILKMDTML